MFSPRLLCSTKTLAGLQLSSLLTFTHVRMPRLSYSVILLEHAAAPWPTLWFIGGRVSIFRVFVHYSGVNVSVASFLSSLHICNVPAVNCVLENSYGRHDAA